MDQRRRIFIGTPVLESDPKVALGLGGILAGAADMDFGAKLLEN